MKKYLIILCILPFLAFAESDEIYQQFTKGMPEFSYNIKKHNFKQISHIGVKFKSKKPMYKNQSGSWYGRFSFGRDDYNSSLKAILGFNKYKDKYINKIYPSLEFKFCQKYVAIEKNVIYLLSAPCNFHWGVDKIADNMKQVLNINPEAEIICISGRNSCKLKE